MERGSHIYLGQPTVCGVCGKHHVVGSPCRDTRKKGDPQSETHGIQAVRRHFGIVMKRPRK